MKTNKRTPIWVTDPQTGKKRNVEPFLDLLSKNNAIDYFQYVDNAIKSSLTEGVDSGDINCMENAFYLYDIRDMFGEMAEIYKIQGRAEQ